MFYYTRYYQFIVMLLIFFIIVLLIFLSFDLYTKQAMFQDLRGNNKISKNATFTYSQITIEESQNESKYIILDVREPEEFSWKHLENSRNIRFGDILRGENTLKKLREISNNKTFAVYCFRNQRVKGGVGRSGVAAQHLIENNISTVVIKSGLEEFSEHREFLNEYPEKNLATIWKNVIEEKESSCVAKFKNYTEIITPSEEFRLEKSPSYLTTSEWEQIKNMVKNKTCAAECVNEETCFYANIFGMRLEEQKGEFEGYIII